MTKVQVVNRQEIDGEEYKRGEVIDLPNGRARDLVNAGKVRLVPPESELEEVAEPVPDAAPVPDPAPKPDPASKGATKQKEGKNA